MRVKINEFYLFKNLKALMLDLFAQNKILIRFC